MYGSSGELAMHYPSALALLAKSKLVVRERDASRLVPLLSLWLCLCLCLCPRGQLVGCRLGQYINVRALTLPLPAHTQSYPAHAQR